MSTKKSQSHQQMSHRIKLLLVLLCSTMASLATAQNFIPNPDWELGPDSSSSSYFGWSTNSGPDDWTPIATPDRIVYGSYALQRDGQPAQSGLAYCIFYGPAPTEGGQCNLIAPLQSGRTYYLSYWLDVDENFDDGPGGMSFNFVGANTINSPFLINTGTWQYFDTSFVASGNSSQLQLIATGNCLMKIDNIWMDTTENTADIPEAAVSANAFWVYPNPTNGEFSIEFTEKQESITVTLLSILGQELQREVFQNRQIVQMELNQPKGLYILEILDSSGNKTVLKIFRD